MAPRAGLVRAERGMSASPSVLCCLATRLRAQPASAGDSRLWGLQGGAFSILGARWEGVSTCEGLQRDLTQMWGCLGGTCVPARSQEILKVTIGYL